MVSDEKRKYKNAVLDDLELQAGLKSINPKFGDFVTRVAGEAWGLPLIDQKTKALIAIAVDVANQNHKGPGNPFVAHVDMALKQGATYEEITEILLFMCAYAGFNKVAGCLGVLKEIFQARKKAMTTAVRKVDYSIRDQKGKVAFYILLWKRKGISLKLFDDYWRNVHGPLCARLPGQHQYWQFHVAQNEGGLWPTVNSVDNTCLEEDQFNGIAELTFETEGDRQTFFQSSNLLMDDERNLFSKAVGYITSPGNSKTYIDSIPTGEPNGELDIIKFHVMVKKSDDVSVEAFRKYLTDSFALDVIQSASVLKFRLHLFEEVDNSRPEAAGVSHHEPLEKQYQAAFEIAFTNPLEMETFFASKEYATAVKDVAQYVKQLLPFPERTAYTFVYDSKMTLAGQCSSNVADLIVKVGATNQLKSDIVSLMSGKQITKSGLGHYLQGVQHVGVTVQDMAKSLEFYTEVLGGKLVIAEHDLVGDGMQNTLFQKEELDAIAKGIDLTTFDVPNLRDAQAALDIKFISFGNTCVELIYFKDPKTPHIQSSSVSSIPSHIGHVNAMHISFHVKDDVDLNVFAKLLEQECQTRGLNNVIFNRVIRVKSEEERRKVALKYNSTKFWNEPDSSAEESETDFGELEGWALFYCKGPNGEQLEFNQATRKVKGLFTQAQEKYNMANNTSFTASNTKFLGINSQQENVLEKVYATFSSSVNASFATAWNVLLDKIENPERYNPEARDYKILEKCSNSILREMKALNMTVTEKIVWDEKTGEVRHTLVNNPLFIGQATNTVVRPANPNELPVITFTLDWEPYNEEARKIAQTIQPKIAQAIQQAVLNAKIIAEQQDTQRTVSNGKVETTNGSKPNLIKFPGTTTDMVKRLFSRGEAFDSEGFITFFTDTPVYQFGNFDVCLDKAAIKKSADAFFSQISAVYHEIKMMWEIADVVFVEMDVTYWRKDGSVITLPCCDIFRVEGNKFSELRIFMDVNPVFNPTIPVPDSASVFTISEGKRLAPPNTMRQHFAEHPEAQERVKNGFAPKWSITGPKWPISSDAVDEKAVAQLKAVGELAQAVTAQDWEKVKSYLTDDIFYKVGSGEVVYGPQAVVDFFARTFKTIAVFYSHDVRKVWQDSDIITIEMDAKYEMVHSKKRVVIACCDVYRLRGNKVSEWRVYADMSPWQS
ncbi:nuclear transport factor 2 family protein [Nostoc sp. MG11]|uniref:nuclear transport factor 2 family protein n=1 Tax=Nostoc sp. MG11 TaxID=2721166 RepID=UPI001D0300B8|nr:nuclear transport factor 2 family protein [Nostoc sp. MG11]